MYNVFRGLLAVLLYLTLNVSYSALAKPSTTALAVWANEAIIATYTFDFEHFLAQEKAIAKYFTAQGWISYSKAMQDSKLPEMIQTNSYYVSAVATMPPVVKTISNTEWEVKMPILVIYTNPAYKQKQNLMVTLRFMQSTQEGIRGYAISSLKAALTEPPCRCAKQEPSEAIA